MLRSLFLSLVPIAFLVAAVPGCATSSRAPEGSAMAYVIRPDIGVDECREGDRIVFSRIEGTHPDFVAGGTYRVRGRWTLASRDAADLELWVMNGETVSIPRLALKRGTGDFDFTFAITRPGFPHLSFYPAGGGAAFGAVFFGTDEESTWRTAFQKP